MINYMSTANKNQPVAGLISAVLELGEFWRHNQAGMTIYVWFISSCKLM